MPRPDEAHEVHRAHPAHPAHRVGARVPTLAAVALATVATVAGVVAGGLTLAAGDPVPWKPLLLPALWSVPGALIASARPRIAVGWLMLAVAVLFAGSGLADAWARHGTEDLRALAIWFVDRSSATLVVCTVLALLLLPDGRLPSPHWRPVVGIVVGLQLLLVAVWSLAAGTAAAPDASWSPSAAALANPVGILPASWGETAAGLDWVLQLPLLLCLAAMAVRLVGSPAEERRRLVAILLALVVFVVVVVCGRAVWAPVGDVLDVLASVFLAVVLVAAVLLRHLEGVSVVVHHACVDAVLGVVVVGAYVLAVGVLAAVGPELSRFGAGVVAAGVALAVHPLRARLQRWVDRLMHGDRRDPYGALTRLAANTHRAPTLDEVLGAVAASVATSMRVPLVLAEAFGARGQHPAQDGPVRSDAIGRGARTVRVPLLAGEREVGSLYVEPQPGRLLRGDEERLLGELGRHAGLAVDSVRLASQVAEHHRDVLAAREEERRRLGRELHDDLGPTVAGLSMQLGALRPLVHTEPDAVVARLARLEQLASAALTDIRRVAHELRPPVLDQVGLGRAVRQVAESLELVVVEEAVSHGPLPAAVELAAYRITAEALTNVARHSGSRGVRLSLRETGGCLVVVVADDGIGLRSADDGAGLGRATMRERAEELGGSLTVRAGERAGTVVTAVLPLLGADLPAGVPEVTP